MGVWRTVIAVILLVVLGVFLIACSAALIPYFVRNLVEKDFALRNNTKAFDSWLIPPAPIFMNFYFFNVTNHEEFTRNWSIKPRVQQIGPYVYRVLVPKSDVEFVNSDKNLRYREHKFYVFERNMSYGDESDVFTTVNLPLLVIANQLRSSAHWKQDLAKVGIIMMNQTLFEKRSVHELLWGYNLTLPDWLPSRIKKLIDDAIKSFNGNSTEFGFYVGPYANGTDDGVYDIMTGVGDISQLAVINTWNGSRTLPYWLSNSCNMINGTDGTMWHPFVSDSERLYAYTPELCRSIYLTCENCRTKMHYPSVEIPVYHFLLADGVFADPKTNPDNEGFCVDPPCSESGILDVSTCRRNAPIIMSEPHFYQASKSIQDAIEGISPRPEYRTFVEVEPTTGLALNVSRQVQVNVHLRYLRALREMDTMNENMSLVFPVMWISVNVTLGEDELAKFYGELLKPLSIVQDVVYVLYAVGGVMLLVSVILLVVLAVRRMRQNSGNIQVNSADGTTDDDDAQLLDAGSA